MTVGAGSTDTRLWRYLDVPASVCGPIRSGMGSGGEHVPVEVSCTWYAAPRARRAAT